MFHLVNAVKTRLSHKILLVLTISVAIVMGVIIYLNLSSQQELIRERMTTFGSELSYLAYAGIKHPMSVGDSPSVEKQFSGVKEVLEGTEIVICDFNQRIVFATHEERLNSEVSNVVHNDEAMAALQNLLHTGKASEKRYFEEEEDGKKYLVTLHPMANTPECHHCHSTSREVLGGLIIRQSTDATYAAITSLRNRTIIISMLGIAAIITIIYFLLSRLVTRPVTELADKGNGWPGAICRSPYRFGQPIPSVFWENRSIIWSPALKTR
jgi:hypothetical protein